MGVEVFFDTEKVHVRSPYLPGLPARAKLLSGRWDPEEKVWSYPLGAQAEVQALYQELYGEWVEEVKKVNLICKVDEAYEALCDPLVLGGRIVARAFGRDSGAKTGEGVIVLKGGFKSGGSCRNWETQVKKGTVFRLLEVPLTIAEELQAHPQWCTSVEIEVEGGEDGRRAALISEREALRKRLSEIEQLLAEEEEEEEDTDSKKIGDTLTQKKEGHMSDEIMIAGEMTEGQEAAFADRYYELWAEAGFGERDDDGPHCSPDPWGWPKEGHPDLVLGTQDEGPEVWAERYFEQCRAELTEIVAEEKKMSREREEDTDDN